MLRRAVDNTVWCVLLSTSRLTTPRLLWNGPYVCQRAARHVHRLMQPAIRGITMVAWVCGLKKRHDVGFLGDIKSTEPQHMYIRYIKEQQFVAPDFYQE